MEKIEEEEGRVEERRKGCTKQEWSRQENFGKSVRWEVGVGGVVLEFCDLIGVNGSNV